MASRALPFFVLLVVVPVSVALFACERSRPTAPAPATLTSRRPLTLVSTREQVCMVTNQFIGRPQIPIEVDGRTYFGCCEMCKGRLAREPSTRTAVDPLSGSEVDKATDVIAQDPAGALSYFENETNYREYVAGGSR